MSGKHQPTIDSVTGYETTGHEWNGILELNTPFPRIVIVALILAFLLSLVLWVLLPAWPTGRDYTRGLLKLDQGQEADQGYQALLQVRSDWRSRFAADDYPALTSDGVLMEKAMPAASRLFADNCSACHRLGGTGGPGFPSLADRDWLWGGDPATIAETITVGINSTDPNTRSSQMPAFGRDGILTREQISAVTDYVLSLSSGKPDPASAGAKIFSENCAACHGEGGRGGLGTGTPSLVDEQWIYGGTRDDIMTTLQGGRQGVMPTWKARLEPTDIHLLALYVSRLNQTAAKEVTP